ncbi:MAG: alpha/beta hydrolase [Sphingorhabdus sp.]
MQITRHYLTIDGRQVHYRRCGKGPPLIMVHQSPRSSAEYAMLMLEWGEHFTCIAPDTPGFGQSHPLPSKANGADPDINDYADAVVEFVRAIRIERTLAYGFHSGGIILVTALKRHPELFTGLAVGGYAIWTPEEMAIFGEAYLPPFQPSLYGEHLTWLWNRILEQSWFFPWFDIRPAARLSHPHADPAKVHAIVMEMLDSGDAYRLGYGAVLRASRDIPLAGARTPPVMISAYDGDPLQAHIDRLGQMPANWEACKVATPQELEERSRAFLKAHAGPEVAVFAEDQDSQFLHVQTDLFDGLIHWRGSSGGETMHIPAPGRSLDMFEQSAFVMDPPGHGLSDDWNGKAPTDWHAWQAVFDVVAKERGSTAIVIEQHHHQGDPSLLFPDLSPNRHGTYLNKAWNIVRARHFFAPWYEADAEHAIDFDPAMITAERLAREHRALLKATAAKAFHIALSTRGE